MAGCDRSELADVLSKSEGALLRHALCTFSVWFDWIATRHLDIACIAHIDSAYFDEFCGSHGVHHIIAVALPELKKLFMDWRRNDVNGKVSKTKADLEEWKLRTEQSTYCDISKELRVMCLGVCSRSVFSKDCGNLETYGFWSFNANSCSCFDAICNAACTIIFFSVNDSSAVSKHRRGQRYI